MNKENNGVFMDHEGKKSSKRIAGFIILINTIIIADIIMFAGISRDLKDDTLIVSILETFLYCMAFLFGVDTIGLLKKFIPTRKGGSK